MIVGVSGAKKSLLYHLLGGFFHRFLAKHAGYFVPRNASNFRIMSRRALNSALCKEKFLYQFFLNVSRTGYEAEKFPYSSLGERRKSVFESATNALRILVFNSTIPLRLVSVGGLVGSLFGLLVSIYALMIHFLKSETPEGWVSINLFVSAQFFLMFLILFLFGEYFHRIIETFKSGQEFEITSDQYSSMVSNVGRVNVTQDT